MYMYVLLTAYPTRHVQFLRMVPLNTLTSLCSSFFVIVPSLKGNNRNPSEQSCNFYCIGSSRIQNSNNFQVQCHKVEKIWAYPHVFLKKSARSRDCHHTQINMKNERQAYGDRILELHFLSRFLGINSSLLRLEFSTLIFHSTKYYSWIDLSFLVSRIFLCVFLKPE
jgi:hypothetical protein